MAKTFQGRTKDNISYDEDGGLLLFRNVLKRVQIQKEGKDAGFCNVTQYVKITLSLFSEPKNIADDQQYGLYLVMGFEIKHKFESDALTSDLAARFQNFANGMEVRSIGGPKVTGTLCTATENTSISASRSSLSGKSLWDWNVKYPKRRRLLEYAGIFFKSAVIVYVKDISRCLI